MGGGPSGDERIRTVLLVAHPKAMSHPSLEGARIILSLGGGFVFACLAWLAEAEDFPAAGSLPLAEACCFW